MKINGKTLTPYFTLLQCLYWSVYCLMFSFASAFLLNKGFSNSSIGMVLGFSYAFSAMLQPVIASYIKRKNLGVSTVLSRIMVVVLVLAATMLFLPLKGAGLGVVMVMMCTLHSSMQPSMNSLHRGYELQGLPVNFGFARGMGSVAFSAVTFLMGQVLRIATPSVIPAAYFTGLIVLLVCMILFRSPAFSENAAVEQKQQPLLRRYPRFGVFLAGLVLLALAHIFLDNFMLQIIHTINGDSGHMGIALAIAAVIELPAMMLYNRMAKKAGGPGRMLCIAGWAWVAKNMLIFLARTPEFIYVAELLQFLSYAVYVPATVDYIAKTMPQSDFLKAQALSGSAFTIGSLLAAMAGGPAIDLLGIRTSVALVQLCSITGAILFSLSVLPRKEKKSV